MYPEVCDGIGCFPGPTYYIHVDPSITHKQTPCQPVPVQLKEPFKHKIDDVLQCKLDECFDKIEQVIITADDIMIVCYKPDDSDHDQVFHPCCKQPRSVMLNSTMTSFNTNKMK